jgi:hypothetical protein
VRKQQTNGLVKVGSENYFQKIEDREIGELIQAGKVIPIKPIISSAIWRELIEEEKAALEKH